MKTQIIKTVFTNILFVFGVILIIFGFIQGSLTLARSIAFDKYPIQSYEETRCDYEFGAYQYKDDGENIVSAEEIKANKEKCEQAVDQTRKVVQVEHVVGSISALIAGLVLVIGFKKFIFA